MVEWIATLNNGRTFSAVVFDNWNEKQVTNYVNQEVALWKLFVVSLKKGEHIDEF